MERNKWHIKKTTTTTNKLEITGDTEKNENEKRRKKKNPNKELVNNTIKRISIGVFPLNDFVLHECSKRLYIFSGNGVCRSEMN